jgi:hypothetical protein
MDMIQKHLQTALPFAMKEASKKLQESKETLEPKHLVNVKRAIFDATKVGTPFDSAEMIEALEPFGYKKSSIMATLLTLVSEKKLSRSQKAPYAYTKLRSWDSESDAPLKVKPVKVKAVNPEDLPRIPPITAFRNNLTCMTAVAKPTSFNTHDLDLVIHHLTHMKVVAQQYAFNHMKYHPDDRDLAIGYGELANDLIIVIEGMYQTKAQLGSIAQMAANLRVMS